MPPQTVKKQTRASPQITPIPEAQAPGQQDQRGEAWKKDKGGWERAPPTIGHCAPWLVDRHNNGKTMVFACRLCRRHILRYKVDKDVPEGWTHVEYNHDAADPCVPDDFTLLRTPVCEKEAFYVPDRTAPRYPWRKNPEFPTPLLSKEKVVRVTEKELEAVRAKAAEAATSSSRASTATKELGAIRRESDDRQIALEYAATQMSKDGETITADGLQQQALQHWQKVTPMDH